MSTTADTPRVVREARATEQCDPICAVRAATVFVDNAERALHFYVDALGFEQRPESALPRTGTGIEVAPPDAMTSLVLVQPSLSTMGVERASVARQRIGEPTGLILEAEDIEEAYTALQSRGVRFGGPPAANACGVKTATFRDPDGNEFVLVEAPRGAPPG